MIFANMRTLNAFRLKWASKASNPFESNQERTDCDFILHLLQMPEKNLFLRKMQRNYWAIDVTDQLRLLKIPAGEAHFLVPKCL